MEPSSKKTRRHYSEREKADALAVYDANGNLSEVARATGIPDSTLSDWINAKHGVSSPDIPILRAGGERHQSNLIGVFDEIAHQATGEVARRLRDPKQARKVPITHLMKAAEVSVDKSQLLQGLPTSINQEVERRELAIILQSAMYADADAGDTIDITPEPPEPREMAPPMPEPVAALAPVSEDPSSNLPAFLFRHPLNDCPT